jgi:hypothetical protein
MGDLLGSIFSYLGGTFASALESFVVWLYQLVVIVFQVLWQTIFIVAQFFVKVFSAVANFFERLWNGFFKSIFTKVWNAVRAAQQWLETKLRPVIEFLKKLRKLEEIYFNRYIRPMLVLIQHVRQYLQILSLLHIRLAQKLDAYLAQLQAKLVQSFGTIVGALNTLINITNALADPTYLLRKPLLLISIRRQIPALIHALTGRPPGYWFPSPKAAKGSPFAPVPANFNFRDSAMNPPTSSYLPHDDGIGDFGAAFDGFQFADVAVDATAPLDYFNNDLYPLPACTDPEQCLEAARRLLIPKVANG